ncbi:MAG: type II toxin-antitoxin system HicB family antitoxin [Spirochaetota bacterium]
MKDLLAYKDFMGSVHFSADDEVFFGKIEGIEDLVSFEGNSVTEIKKAFEEAVEDYAQICRDNGTQLEKSYKGSFNVRIPPDLHRKVRRTAVKLGISLNQFIQKAVEDEIEKTEMAN